MDRSVLVDSRNKVYQFKFSLVIFGILSFSSLSYLRSSLVDEGTLEKDLYCPSFLEESRSANIDRMFFQIGKILDKIEVTETNKKIVLVIKNKFLHWKKGQRDFTIKTLLQIFYFLNVHPSIALGSNSLEEYGFVAEGFR